MTYTRSYMSHFYTHKHCCPNIAVVTEKNSARYIVNHDIPSFPFFILLTFNPSLFSAYATRHMTAWPLWINEKGRSSSPWPDCRKW